MIIFHTSLPFPARMMRTRASKRNLNQVEGKDVKRNRPRVLQTNPSHGIVRFGMLLTGVLWMFEKVPNILCTPVTTHMTKDTPTISFLERSAFDLFQRASTNSGLMRDETSAQTRELFPKRNMWELISASTDVIPLRNSLSNNGSSQFLQWPGGGGGSSSQLHPQLSVETRLQKLDHHFNSLRVHDEDCRQRLLCEIAESPAKFAPLTSAFLDETSFNGDEKSLASKLLETNEGAKLLTYIEATQRGISRHGCEIWTYRCPRTATSMIDFKSLLVWREVSKWLTVKFVARKHQS